MHKQRDTTQEEEDKEDEEELFVVLCCVCPTLEFGVSVFRFNHLGKLIVEVVWLSSSE